jgi:hypothetical protein
MAKQQQKNISKSQGNNLASPDPSYPAIAVPECLIKTEAKTSMLIAISQK